MYISKRSLNAWTEIWDFTLSGSSFKATDGTRRQTSLRRAAKKQNDFERFETVTVDLERYEYEGAPAYMVYFDDREVGNVPAEVAAELAKMEDAGYIISGDSCEIYGGPDEDEPDKKYGARIWVKVRQKQSGEPQQSESASCPQPRNADKKGASPNYDTGYRRKPSKPFYKKWWFLVLAVILISNLTTRIPEIMREKNQREAAQILSERSQQAQTETTAASEDDGYTEEEQAAAAKEYYEKIGYDPTQEQETPDVEDDGISVLEPVVSNSANGYSGSGDDYFEITPLDELWYMEITGNVSGNHFAVKGYDSFGEYTELFVNTLEPYSGSVFELEQSTRMLEVTSTGDWTVRVKPLSSAPVLPINEAYSGSGDAVLLVPSGCTSAKITGNSGSNHFAVKGYGDYYDLLVNTLDPYSGTVRLERNIVVLTITAEGSWQITVG